MIHNQSAWSTYPEDDRDYIDPLYTPYELHHRGRVGVTAHVRGGHGKTGPRRLTANENPLGSQSGVVPGSSGLAHSQHGGVSDEAYPRFDLIQYELAKARADGARPEDFLSPIVPDAGTQGTDLVNPGLVRRGWGLDFQLLHPDDSCPIGWEKAMNNHTGEGWCVREKHESGDFGLYSNRSHTAAHQYWDGYTATPRPRAVRSSGRRGNTEPRVPQFSNYSINYHTGNQVVYHRPTPHVEDGKYRRLPSTDSYIA